MKQVMTIALAMMLAGCMTSQVMVGEARTPLDPSQVKIYSSPPMEYEEIAMIQSSSKASWAVSEQGKVNKTINRMKEAAANAANGILITGIGEGTVPGAVTTYNGGFAYTGGAQYKSGQSIAIWVEKE